MRARGVLFGVLSVLCAALALAVGCADKTDRMKTSLAEHTGNYSAVARIRYRDFEASAAISQVTPASCSVRFDAPESLKGMDFIFRQDTVDLSYKGLGFRFETDSLPGGAVAGLIVSAMNKAMSGEGISAVEEDGAIYLAGSLENGGFSLRLDGESGLPIKLSVPGEELEIEFSDFRFLD